MFILIEVNAIRPSLPLNQEKENSNIRATVYNAEVQNKYT